MTTLTQRAGALGLTAVLLLTATGCGSPTVHPGQLNAMDGATYDSLTVAHAALGSLRLSIQTTYPQYVQQFNQANASYTTAYTSYSLFRSMPDDNSAQLAIAISNLTTSVISLENAFAAGMNNTPALNAARSKAHARLRVHGMSLTDILTELEIAASVAAAIPGAGPYAQLAVLVIAATQSAVNALAATQALPINLTTILPFAAI